MKESDFSPNAPGQLLPVANGCAFLPDPLPPRIDASWELTRRVEEAMTALSSLSGYALAAGSHELLARALVAREAVESNRIEGTHTQILDVIKQEVLGPPSDPERAARQLEVIRSWQAADQGAAWLSEGRPLSPYLIRALHETLLSGTRGSDKNPGAFRSRQVVIGHGGDTVASATFVPPPPEFVPERIQHLVDFMLADLTYPILVSAAIAHYYFEAVHPFEDGNGRLGRVLVTLMLLARNALELPLLFVSPYLIDHDARYKSLLQRVSTEGAWDEWIAFFLDAILFQANDGLRRARLMVDLRERYHATVRANTKGRNVDIGVDLIMEKGVITIPMLAANAKCSFPAAKAALMKLEDLGIAGGLGTYPASWVAHEVIAQIYGDESGLA